jgi:tetrahydromethanopterin S-methyltransferase subunit E
MRFPSYKRVDVDDQKWVMDTFAWMCLWAVIITSLVKDLNLVTGLAWGCFAYLDGWGIKTDTKVKQLWGVVLLVMAIAMMYYLQPFNGHVKVNVENTVESKK